MTRRHYLGLGANPRTRKAQPNANISSSSQHIRLIKSFWKSICGFISTATYPTKTTRLNDQEITANIFKTSMYSYIPEKIRQEFESNIFSSQISTLVAPLIRSGIAQSSVIKLETTLLRGREVVIYISSSSSSSSTDPKHEICVKNMIAWLNYISEFASPKCAQTLQIYLLLTDAKKRMPDMDEDPIDEIHANTAFTTACSSANTIYIFRREEWFKVFMHETIHCFGLDFSALNTNGSNSSILSCFPAVNPTTDIRLYETFCEMWAEIFHLMFSLFLSKDGRCSPFSETRFRTALQKEQIFSIYQSNKILKRAGYKYDELFMSDHPPAKKYTEKTPAFSYYVLKSVLLWNFDKFIKWCVKYAGRDSPEKRPEGVSLENHPIPTLILRSGIAQKHPLQFNPPHIAEYCDFVVELSKQTAYIRKVERIRNTTMPSKIKDIPDIENTMRMTTIDPKWYQEC